MDLSRSNKILYNLKKSEKFLIRIYLFLLLTFPLFAQTVIATGSAKPDYAFLDEAINNAKRSAIIAFQKKQYPDEYQCLNDDFSANLDDYKVTLIREKSVDITLKHLIVVVELEIIEINKDLGTQLADQCNEAKEHRIFVNNVSSFADRFHFGFGAFGWPPIYGAEVYAEFTSGNLEGLNFGYYATYSMQTLSDSTLENPSADIGNTSNVGLQLRVSYHALGAVIGYDSVLNHSNNFDTTLATYAIVWGFIYTPSDSSFEYGFIFKDFDDKNDNRDGSISGGLLVRYNLF